MKAIAHWSASTSDSHSSSSKNKHTHKDSTSVNFMKGTDEHAGSFRSSKPPAPTPWQAAVLMLRVLRVRGGGVQAISS